MRRLKASSFNIALLAVRVCSDVSMFQTVRYIEEPSSCSYACITSSTETHCRKSTLHTLLSFTAVILPFRSMYLAQLQSLLPSAVPATLLISL